MTAFVYILNPGDSLTVTVPATVVVPPPVVVPPVVVPPTSTGLLLGTLGMFPTYGGGSPPNGLTVLTGFEALLGRRMKYVVQFGAGASTDEFEGSVWGFTTDPNGNLRPVANRVTLVVGIPLCFGHGSPSVAEAKAWLTATVNGQNDASFQRAFQYIKDGGFTNVILRLGWEFDGGWMPWMSQGNEVLWAAAFGHVAFIARSMLPGVRLDYNGTLGYEAQYKLTYPGDNVVDIMGLDVYDKGAARLTVGAGMGSHAAFAKLHGKPVSYPEWGLTGNVADSGGDNPPFITTMVAQFLMDGTNLAYESYFQSDESDGWHALSHFPNSYTKYKALVTA